MNRRQRVIQALRHKITDIIPYNIDLTEQEREKMVEYTGDEGFINRIGNHIDGYYYSGFTEGITHELPGKQGYFKDDFGVIWNRNGADKDIGIIEDPVIKDPKINVLHMPEIDLNTIRKGFERLVNNGRDTFKIGGIGFSMYERAWSLRGMENFLTDMLLEPEFATYLLDEICNFNMKIIDIGLSYDIDGFYFGDDWGQQAGMIMGPKLWRKFIKPRMARMYGRVKSKGKFVFQHSCGDIHEIYPDLIEIGLDVHQTFQPEIYDIHAIKKEFGDRLSFWGGISTQRLLPFATAEEVKLKTIETMKIIGENGGYIAAPTHSVPGDVPPENVLAMLEVFQNQEKYLKRRIH